jgi:hypothetical protein
MAIDLTPETVSLFLLGIWLVSLARFGRKFFKKHDPDKTLFSDSMKKLRLEGSLRIKLKSIQKKVERLILASKGIEGQNK